MQRGSASREVTIGLLSRAVYFYYKVEVETAANNGAGLTGSNFTGGTLAISCAAGLAIGAVITALSTIAFKKKKETAAA